MMKKLLLIIVLLLICIVMMIAALLLDAYIFKQVSGYFALVCVFVSLIGVIMALRKDKGSKD